MISFPCLDDGADDEGKKKKKKKRKSSEELQPTPTKIAPGGILKISASLFMGRKSGGASPFAKLIKPASPIKTQNRVPVETQNGVTSPTTQKKNRLEGIVGEIRFLNSEAENVDDITAAMNKFKEISDFTEKSRDVDEDVVKSNGDVEAKCNGNADETEVIVKVANNNEKKVKKANVAKKSTSPLSRVGKPAKLAVNHSAVPPTIPELSPGRKDKSTESPKAKKIESPKAVHNASPKLVTNSSPKVAQIPKPNAKSPKSNVSAGNKQEAAKQGKIQKVNFAQLRAQIAMQNSVH